MPAPSAPAGDVVDRLERLAAHAPTAGVDPDRLWARGRRRQDRRRWAAAVLAAVVVAGVGVVASVPLARLVTPPVASDPDSGPVLPDEVRVPGRWDRTFDEAPGRLAAIGMAERSSVVSSSTDMWGVSATTGESRWLDLPHLARYGPSPGAALSPDGRRLAYWATDGRAGAQRGEDALPATTGLAVLDLVTGESWEWDGGSRLGIATGPLTWSGDTLWFVSGAYSDATRSGASMETRTWSPGVSQPRQAEVDLGSGLVTSLGEGFLMSDGTATRKVRHVADDGAVSTIRLVQDGTVSTASLGPDGTTLVGIQQGRQEQTSGVARPLLVGTVAGARALMTPLEGVEAAYVLGWRSPTEVVVGSPRDPEDSLAVRASVVDLTDGSATPLIELPDANLVVAAGAWSGEVVEAPGAPFSPGRWAIGTTVTALTLLLVGWGVRRRRRGHP